VLLAGCAGEPARPDNGVAVVRSTADDGFAGNLLERPYPKPAGAFTDTAGRPFDWSATKPVTIVFFGYTHCPDICNTVMADVASALRRVDPQVRRKVDVVFVTTDPARDTGPVIRRWLDAFDPAFVGLTAPLPTIEKSAETLGVGLTGNTPAPRWWVRGRARHAAHRVRRHREGARRVDRGDTGRGAAPRHRASRRRDVSARRLPHPDSVGP
jgi:protein SCO1/2